MELKITGRHAKLKPETIAYAEDKLSRVERYDRATRLLEVVIDVRAKPVMAEGKAHVAKGPGLVVHGTGTSVEAAVDDLHDKLERALRRHKEKVRDRVLDGRRKSVDPAPAAAAASAAAERAAALGEEE